MSRSEVIQRLKVLRANAPNHERYVFDMSIEALEQEGKLEKIRQILEAETYVEGNMVYVHDSVTRLVHIREVFMENEQMEFPNTFDEFAKEYGFNDKKEVYTNGSELIPVFRVKQWLEHIECKAEDCVSRAYLKQSMIEYGWQHPDSTVTEYVESLPSVYPKSEIKVEDMGRYDPYTDKFI